MKLRITGLLPAVVPPPDVLPDDDDPLDLEEPEAPLPLLLLPLLPELPLEPLLSCCLTTSNRFPR